MKQECIACPVKRVERGVKTCENAYDCPFWEGEEEDDKEYYADNCV